ncbi:MAG: 4-hydroxy-3-methylbut-2-enyl diphosphate reductase, partial [Gammaproteobacteria bacterium]
SAHGVSKAVRNEAQRRGLRVFDATCPLVTKVHMEVSRYARDALDVVLIGHAGHPEVEGTMGQFDAGHGGAIHLVQNPEDVATLQVKDPRRVAFVTQTTLSMDDTARIIEALRSRFPEMAGPRKDDICYATQNRQDAVKKLAHRCEVMLVVGSSNSSNSNRLREIAEHEGAQAYLIDGPEDIRKEWLSDKQTVGVTAGASAPEVLVQNVVERLQAWGGHAAIEADGIPEHVMFALPKELRKTEPQH